MLHSIELHSSENFQIVHDRSKETIDEIQSASNILSEYLENLNNPNNTLLCTDNEDYKIILVNEKNSNSSYDNTSSRNGTFYEESKSSTMDIHRYIKECNISKLEFKKLYAIMYQWIIFNSTVC